MYWLREIIASELYRWRNGARIVSLPIVAASIAILLASWASVVQTHGKTMTASPVSLGYVIVVVKDVSASLDFYEKAFGLKRRFFNEDQGKAYGELDTGAACLAFANWEMAKSSVGPELTMPAADRPSAGMEFALVTADVDALYQQAVKAGAIEVRKPEAKPWGQKVAYVRDKDGYLVELCTPVQS
jgi:lactoylglutathione lyase